MNSRGIAPPTIWVDELVLRALARLDEAGDAAVLAGAARLLLVGVVEVGVLGDRLAVRPTRGGEVTTSQFVLALHALDVDVEVQLAMPDDDGVAGSGSELTRNVGSLREAGGAPSTCCSRSPRTSA